MDKLYYFVLNTEKWLADHHANLDDWETMDASYFVNELTQLCSSSCRTLVADVSDNSECEDDMVDDNSVDPLYDISLSDNDMKFGQLLRCFWSKRREKMCHDFAITAWLLSPCPQIRAHVKENLGLEHKLAAERMLLKLFLPDDLTPEAKAQQTAVMIDEFWNEYEWFDNRLGPFGEGRHHIWVSADITDNRSCFWHKKFSYLETKQLGRLACRVTSKINGMGNAERCWGTVKQLKNGQRSHLTASSVTKAATIFGAACAERAKLKPPPSHVCTVTHWEEADMESLGLNRFGVDVTAIVADGLPCRPYRCWTEDWEHDLMRINDIEAQAKFLQKYGGLAFSDGPGSRYYAHPTKMSFCKKRGNPHWTVFGCKESYNAEEEYEDDYDTFDINDDFHGLVYEHYKANPTPGVKTIVPPGSLDAHGAWDLWQPVLQAPARKKHKK
jgi:hypothetical protein